MHKHIPADPICAKSGEEKKKKAKGRLGLDESHETQAASCNGTGKAEMAGKANRVSR